MAKNGGITLTTYNNQLLSDGTTPTKGSQILSTAIPHSTAQYMFKFSIPSVPQAQRGSSVVYRMRIIFERGGTLDLDIYFSWHQSRTGAAPSQQSNVLGGTVSTTANYASYPDVAIRKVYNQSFPPTNAFVTNNIHVSGIKGVSHTQSLDAFFLLFVNVLSGYDLTATNTFNRPCSVEIYDIYNSALNSSQTATAFLSGAALRPKIIAYSDSSALTTAMFWWQRSRSLRRHGWRSKRFFFVAASRYNHSSVYIAARARNE